jgi:Fic family protein
MLPDYLVNFNSILKEFQDKFPVQSWSPEFRNSLVNDYSFFSARIEDSKLQYGDTIRFLNAETIRSVNLPSLLGISEHQKTLSSLLNNLDEFNISELTIKSIHKSLMNSKFAWDGEYKAELVGQYRNFPTVGSRLPFFENKQYAPHYNLEIIMASYIDMFKARFNDVDNSLVGKHIISRIAYFHNKFLNEIHPFADGNGRVCRIIIGAVLMKNNCPPIFPKILDQESQLEYISTIIECEKMNSDNPLITYLAKGMSEYMTEKIKSF